MADFFVPGLALAGLLLSVAIEQLLTPRPPLRRPLASWLLHSGAWCIVFGTLLAASGRAGFSAINTLVLWLLIVLVSNAKYQSLREPFVCADFEYFSDAVKFPRLYLPFFGIGKAIGLAVAFVAYLWAGLHFEHRDRMAASDAFVLLALGMVLLRRGHQRWAKPTFEASEDLLRWGLVACLWRYWFAARRAMPVVAAPFAVPRATPQGVLPDLISVQSESFFDVRPLFPGIKAQVLSEFDRLKAQALAHGSLQVAAWGANTVRTEFAWLTGLAPHSLGVHRFNPYRILARRGLPSIASELKRQGYRTVCIHPYAGAFYGRDKVLPALGFDAFIDVRAFSKADLAGPFVGDVAVANKVLAMLGESGRQQPLFIHVVTMENHGPLQLEQVSAEELPQWFSQPLTPALKDLGPYVRHVANADRMLGVLREGLLAHARPAALCFYGDHVPILPEVYAALGTPPGNTDYFIWHNRLNAEVPASELPVYQLAEHWLNLAQHSGAGSAQQVKRA